MADKITVEIGTERFAVTGSDFGYMLMVVKNIPDRQWDAERKIWHIPGERRELALRRLNEGYAKITRATRNGYRSNTMRFALTVTPVQ